MFNKNDPLIGAVQEVMKKNQAERNAAKLVNEKFGVTDRKALPHEKQGAWDAAYKQILSEGLHPNQQKLDVHEPEKDKLTKHDFKMLRAKKKPMEEAQDPMGGDTTSPSSMGIKKPNYATGTPDYAKPKTQTVNRAEKTSLPPGTMKEEEQIDEANSKEQLKAKYDKHHDQVSSELENQALGRGKSMSASKLKRKADAAGTAEWMLNKDGRKKHRYSKNHAKKFFTGKKVNEDKQLDEKATSAQKAKIAKVMSKWKKGKEHIGKSEKTVKEGFNNRHDSSVTASVEEQVVAEIYAVPGTPAGNAYAGSFMSNQGKSALPLQAGQKLSPIGDKRRGTVMKTTNRFAPKQRPNVPLNRASVAARPGMVPKNTPPKNTPPVAAAKPAAVQNKPAAPAPAKVAMTARKIEAPKRQVSASEIMNSAAYKNAVKGVGGENAARKIQAGTNIKGVGTLAKGETIYGKVASQLANSPVKGFEAGANKGGAGR